LVNSKSLTHQVANSPTTLRHSRHVSLERRLAETEAAEAELPHVCAGTSAEMTTVAEPNLELRLLELFGDFCSCCHMNQL
jgi:cytochrome c5